MRNRQAVYMRVGCDPLEKAQFHISKAAAIRSFRQEARELWRYGQLIQAALHIATSREELKEYPDFVLSLNRNGNVRIDRT